MDEENTLSWKRLVVGSGFVNQNLASKFPDDQLTFLAFSRQQPA
jgi:hypothetical protein